MLNTKKAKYDILRSVLLRFNLATLSNDTPITGFAVTALGFVAAYLDRLVDRRFARGFDDAAVPMNVI